MKLLIRQATLVTVNERDEVLPDADLAIAEDKIVGVGSAPHGFVPDRISTATSASCCRGS